MPSKAKTSSVFQLRRFCNERGGSETASVAHCQRERRNVGGGDVSRVAGQMAALLILIAPERPRRHYFGNARTEIFRIF